MTVSVVVMIIIGIIFVIASFFVSERITKREDNFNIDLLRVDDDYEFSERELRIIKRKIEDVIANQAKDILYETNESLSSMANEKTMALGDYAVTVCDEIERNHKEVMFLYSMLDDKQKEIMNTVRSVNDVNREVKELLSEVKAQKSNVVEGKEPKTRKTGIDQLTSLKQMKENLLQDEKSANHSDETIQKEPVAEEVVVKTEAAERQEVEENATVISEENKNAGVVPEMPENEDLNEVFGDIDTDDLDFDEAIEEEFEENENSNDIILELYQNGDSIIEIAKQLGLGVGEVKLVIDLYRGEEK